MVGLTMRKWCQTLQKHYPNSLSLQKDFLEKSINNKSLFLLGIYSIEKEKIN